MASLLQRYLQMAWFLGVAELAEKMADEGSRLKKRGAIAEALLAAEAENRGGEDAGLFALYLAGLPFAEADTRKLNAGGALLTRAVKAVTGAEDAALAAAYRRHGDMGSAAYDLLQGTTRPASGEEGLTLEEVAAGFAAMASARTTAGRSALLEGLLRRCAPVEAKYMIKLMLGDMRIGVKESLVEEAIAVAAEAEVRAVRHAVMLEANLAGAVRRAFDGTLGEARMRLFHPLGFMLASPVDSPEEAVERFTAKPERAATVAEKKKKKKTAEALESDPERETEVAVAVEGAAAADAVRTIEALLEDKYDGMRAQVHCGDLEQEGRVAIYSRNREEVTESFPELAEAFAHAATAGTGALILDGEILGWDFARGEEAGGTARALPFAVLGQRIGRKRVKEEWRRQVPVVFMAFDVLYADGGLTLGLPLRERRNRLEAIAEKLTSVAMSPIESPRTRDVAQRSIFEEAEGSVEQKAALPRLMLSPIRLVESAEDIDRAYMEARARANEGVMLKAAGSTYQPGRRGLAWVKLKRELATLDVVITGAEFGNGRRAAVLSDYTFAVRDAEGELRNVGKAYSGLTDAEIAEMTTFLQEHTIEEFGHFRTVEPLVVLEVAFNNIMRSERHASGFALRFPRILRIRTDKPVSEIDTVARVEAVYQSQVDKPVEA